MLLPAAFMSVTVTVSAGLRDHAVVFRGLGQKLIMQTEPSYCFF